MKQYTVTGMTCAACSARVEKVSRAVPGVTKVEVNLLAGTMVAEAEVVAADEADSAEFLQTGQKILPIHGLHFFIKWQDYHFVHTKLLQ